MTATEFVASNLLSKRNLIILDYFTIAVRYNKMIYLIPEIIQS